MPRRETHSVERGIERTHANARTIVGDRGWSLAIDNDLFGMSQSDCDYTVDWP
jgi:hypothetical protein